MISEKLRTPSDLRVQYLNFMHQPSDLRVREDFENLHQRTPSDLRVRKLESFARTPSDLRVRKSLNSPYGGIGASPTSWSWRVHTHPGCGATKARPTHGPAGRGPGGVQHGQAFSRTRARGCR